MSDEELTEFLNKNPSIKDKIKNLAKVLLKIACACLSFKIKLESLDLSGNTFTNASLDDLKKMTKLNRLILKQCLIDQEEINKFKEEHESLDVEYSIQPTRIYVSINDYTTKSILLVEPLWRLSQLPLAIRGLV